MAQLERLWAFVDNSVPHVIVGDFNALCIGDYSEEYLHEIALIREEGRWEAPQFDVINAVLAKGYIDVFRTLNPSLRDEDTITNRFHTRIDYIFASPAMADLVDWTASECLIVDRPDLSDHFPIAADLVFKSNFVVPADT